MNVNYKQKYMEIRAKLLESTDVAFRLGFEEGMKQGERSAQQAMEQQQMDAMLSAPTGVSEGAPPGMEPGESVPGQSLGEGGVDNSDQDDQSQDEEESIGGSELDQAMGELEDMVSKGEKPKVTDLRKAIQKLTSIRKKQISRAKKRQRQVVSAQSQFVSNILKSWDKNTKDVTEGLEEVIKEHGFKVE